MKNSAIIVNTSRGPIVNEKDLIYALKNKIIFGAGLDVYDVEPLPRKHVLRELSKSYNLVLTPHVGYVSEETYKKFHSGYVKAIKSFINGNPVNILNWLLKILKNFVLKINYMVMIRQINNYIL